MLILLCAVSVGQIQDVAKLRENYEKAQAHYEKVEALYARTQKMYAYALNRDSRTNESNLPSAILTNPRFQAMREGIAARRAEFERMREKMLQERRRRYAESLRQMEMRLLRMKQQVDALKWQYELAAGRPSEHFA